MPRKKQQRQNRSQAQQRESTPGRAGQHQSKPKNQRRTSSGRWFINPTVQWAGIGVIVVAIIVALVAFEVSTSSGGDFEFTMYQGEDSLPISELKYSQLFPAEKPVVLNFWAGLCPVCRVDMPIFQEVYEQFEDEFIFLALDIGPFVGLGDQRNARNLLDELNITYPAGYVHNRGSLTKFGVTGTPTTIFLTPEGKVFKKRPGYMDHATMTGIIQDLLRTSATPS